MGRHVDHIRLVHKVPHSAQMQHDVLHLVVVVDEVGNVELEDVQGGLEGECGGEALEVGGLV